MAFPVRDWPHFNLATPRATSPIILVTAHASHVCHGRRAGVGRHSARATRLSDRRRSGHRPGGRGGTRSGVASRRAWTDRLPRFSKTASHRSCRSSATSRAPLSLCILLDSSPSMASGRQTLAIRTDRHPARRRSEPDDEAALLFFASKVRVAFPWTSAPRSQAGVVARMAAVARDRAHRRDQGRHCGWSSRRSNPLPVILVVSDGGENVERHVAARIWWRRGVRAKRSFTGCIPICRLPVCAARQSGVQPISCPSWLAIPAAPSTRSARLKGREAAARASPRGAALAVHAGLRAEAPRRRQVPRAQGRMPPTAISIVRHRGGYLASTPEP